MRLYGNKEIKFAFGVPWEWLELLWSFDVTFVTGFKIEIKSQANFQLRFWLTRTYSGEDDLIKVHGFGTRVSMW